MTRDAAMGRQFLCFSLLIRKTILSLVRMSPENDLRDPCVCSRTEKSVAEWNVNSVVVLIIRNIQSQDYIPLCAKHSILIHFCL